MTAGATPAERPLLGRLATVAIVVHDYDEAVAWYRDRLGLRVVADTDLGGGKRWVVVGPVSGAGARILLAKASGEQQQHRIGDQTGGVWASSSRLTTLRATTPAWLRSALRSGRSRATSPTERWRSSPIFTAISSI